MYVYPAPGLTVIRPDTHAALPPTGADMPVSQQAWVLRGLQSGDLTLTAPVGSTVTGGSGTPTVSGGSGGTTTPTPTSTAIDPAALSAAEAAEFMALPTSAPAPIAGVTQRWRDGNYIAFVPPAGS